MRVKSCDKGFTLIELMVVVAIIGILASIAIPNFKKYQGKAKTTEAKIQLSAVFMTEQQLDNEYDSYGTCLENAGYSAPKKNNYYAIGFKQPNATANKNITDAGLNCPNTGYQFDANRGSKGNVAKGTDLPNDALVNGGTEYKAGAVAVLDSEKKGPNADTWTIDQDKDLRHVKVGY
tara:strand:- start:14679 stop:15209 length:531 start_codon:yes stop_codon:yes gene_type:complete